MKKLVPMKTFVSLLSAVRKARHVGHSEDVGRFLQVFSPTEHREHRHTEAQSTQNPWHRLRSFAQERQQEGPGASWAVCEGQVEEHPGQRQSGRGLLEKHLGQSASCATLSTTPMEQRAQRRLACAQFIQ